MIMISFKTLFILSAFVSLVSFVGGVVVGANSDNINEENNND